MSSIETNRKNRLLRGSLLLFLGNGVSNLCNYLYQFFMSRHLSIEDFAAMNSLLSVMVVISVPAASISLVAAKYISTYKAVGDIARIKRLLKKMFQTLLTYGGILFVSGLLTAPWVASFLKIPSVLPVMILSSTLLAAFMLPVTVGALQGLQKFLHLALCISLMGFLKLFFGVLLVLCGFMLNGVMVAVMLSILIPFGVFLLPLSGSFDTHASRAEPKIKLRSIAGFSIPVLFSSLAIIILVNLDLILVKHYFPAAEAGLYASVAVLGRTVFYFPGVIIMALYPFASESHAVRKDSKHLLNSALMMTVLMAGIATALLMAFPDYMLSFLFGKNFSGGSTILRTFSLSMFFMSIINVLAKYLLAVEKLHYIMILFMGIGIELIGILFFHHSLTNIPLIMISVTGVLACLIAYEAYRPIFSSSKGSIPSAGQVNLPVQRRST